MHLSDLIIKSANAAIRLQRRDGSISPGHNGPYHDQETPVRNTGHYIITFSKAYELSGEKVYLDGINQAAEYLFSDSARPQNHSFYHRSKDGKDSCNGLIGQAWTFEALVKASEILNDLKYVQLAEDVFFQHHFNEHYGLWNRLEINGDILSIDTAFNHQLWFAAASSLIYTSGKEQINERILQFLNCLDDNLSVLDNGLIYHPITRIIEDQYSKISTRIRLKKFIIKILKILKYYNHVEISNEEKHNRMIYKSTGYHQFNMYAFAILKLEFLNHSYWETEELKKMVSFMLTDNYKKNLDENKYGYSYNPPGFEVPYALAILSNLNDNDLIDLSKDWLNEQIQRCYSPETGLMDRDTEDPKTHAARVYEATRILDLKLFQNNRI